MQLMLIDYRHVVNVSAKIKEKLITMSYDNQQSFYK